MRTETINIYQFAELSETAKQKAIDWYREDIPTQHIYDEAHNSVKAFLDLLPNVKEGNKSWLDPNFDRCEDYHLEMSGLRLRTWLMNNIYDSICKPSYIRYINGNHPHNLTKVCNYSNGKNYTNIYSSFKKDFECPLTGVYYDMELLQPIIDHIKMPHPSVTFEDLINMCFTSLEKAIGNEIKYLNTDEACVDAIESNGYEFNENGTIYYSNQKH